MLPRDGQMLIRDVLRWGLPKQVVLRLGVTDDTPQERKYSTQFTLKDRENGFSDDLG
ncbi:unannotated protein [freshwater metagenome]|uniref:Unannotated protein n=1 Tax=freshwater metagenome TaxID=449393 RepID=A0A6J7GSB8_9ZZZZ